MVLFVKKIVFKGSIDEPIERGTIYGGVVYGHVVYAPIYTGADCFLICHGYFNSDFIRS